MSAWWEGVAPLEVRVACQGAVHRLRWVDGELQLPDHRDLERDQAVVTLGGQARPCLELWQAWQELATDLRVLVLGARGWGDLVLASDADGERRPGLTPGGPLGVAVSAVGGVADLAGKMIAAGNNRRVRQVAALRSLGEGASAALASAVAGGRRPAAGPSEVDPDGAAELETRSSRQGAGDGPRGTAGSARPGDDGLDAAGGEPEPVPAGGRVRGRRGARAEQVENGPVELTEAHLRLFELGRLGERLAAGVYAHWLELAETGDPAGEAALPALEAALAGRALAAYRAWQGDVTPPRVEVGSAAYDGGVLSLPLSWVTSVWARDSAVLAGCFTLSAKVDGPRVTATCLDPTGGRCTLRLVTTGTRARD